MKKIKFFLQIQLQLYRLDLFFEVVDGVDELLFPLHVVVFWHLRADVMHEFPNFLDFVQGDLEGLIQRVERMKPQVAVDDMVFNDFEDYSVVDGEDDVRLFVVYVVPVEDVFSGDVRLVGDGQHGVAADLEGAVFPLPRQKRQLERGEDADVFRVGVTSCVSCLCALRHELNVLDVVAVDGGGEHPDVAAFQMHVVAAFELVELKLADLRQVHLY